MEHSYEEIEVGKGVFRSVDYTWEADDEKVTINMRYEGRQIDPLEFWPPVLVSNDERARDLVCLMARWLYDEEKPSDAVFDL